MGSDFSDSSARWSGYEHQLLQDTNTQVTVVEDEKQKGVSQIIRHPTAKDGFLGYLKDDTGSDINTVWKIANQAFKKYTNLPMFGYRPFLKPEEDLAARGKYEWDTYGTIQQQVYALSNAMSSLNFPEKSNIGIFAGNRSEWLVSHLSNWQLSYRTVALYDTLGAQAIQYIVWHGELTAIFVEKNKLPQLFEAIESCPDDKTLKLKYVIQYDYQEKYNNKHENVSDEDVKRAKELIFGLELIGFTQLLQKVTEVNELNDLEPAPEDLAYIMYTSGTTGDPKGVMLSHKAFATTVGSAFRSFDANSTDRHVSYLPLAHIYESLVQLVCIHAGAQVAFFCGNIKRIALDWAEIEPTIMVGVPRIYSKSYDKIHNTLAADGGMKKWLFDKAIVASSKAIKKGNRSGLYDKLLWRKVAKLIGFHKVRLLVSGAAPLPPHVAEFLRIVCKGALVIQGYGLTETCAAGTSTLANDLNLGHVGVPIDNAECRLIDAPECEYFVDDKPYARGEIQIRSESLMDGYYKNKQKTHEVLADGWFSTGDIGRINPNGTLSIIDRRKNMFKTAMGEYIASEKCECIYSKAPCVGQIWIYGNSFKSFVVAIIVPDPLWLVPLLIEKQIWNDEKLTPATKKYCDKFEKIVTENYDVVKSLLVENVNQIESQSDLKRFEKIKDFHIECKVDELLQGFNVENNTLTPTFKKKRPQLFKIYVQVIKDLYEKNGEPANENEHW